MKRQGAINWLSVFSLFVVLVVVGSLVAGLAVTGGPERARKEVADEKRADDLLTLLKTVRTYYKKSLFCLRI